MKARPRDAYYPNSEDLGPNEMRVIACGNGISTARPSLAAACFLVELGNGDMFTFDVGIGSAERYAVEHFRQMVNWNLAGAVEIGGRPYRARRYRETRTDPARSETPSTHGNTLHGNREIPRPPEARGAASRTGKSEDTRQ